MKVVTLKQIILDYVNHANGFVTKGELYFEAQRQLFSPEGVGRTCRLLAERRPDHEPEIKVDYYPGRKRKVMLARYASLDTTQLVKIINKPTFIEKPDGTRVAVFN